jgi:hypothetical protein
MVDPDIK